MDRPAAYTELQNLLAEIHDLSHAGSLLAWDERTMMPPKGGPVRAEQLATLARVRHEKATADDLGRVLDQLASYERSQPHDSHEASLVRVARRDYEKARRVPPELRAEMARASSLGARAWREARSRSDFSLLEPHLARHVELALRYVECFPDADHVYDPLLDDYEPGMKTAEAAAVLDALKAGLLPLSAAIAERTNPGDGSPLEGDFPVAAQRKLVGSLAIVLPLDCDAFRLDETAHPFEMAIATGDVRITTRYDDRYIGSALFSVVHEFGHGLYEHGVDPALERTPLCRGVSLGVHESQSRLWENLVGRSRPFWRWFGPHMQQAFPGQLDGAGAEELYRAANRVEGSLIRVEADQVTYDLHIVIRFELEQELMEGKLAPAELPEAWNARVERYLGLEVLDDAHGVLQDIHWSEGSFGYFPTYSLGNVLAAQIWKRAVEELPHLEAHIARGEFAPLAAWLRETLHRHGRKFTPAETIERVVGGPLDVAPYMEYLKAKFGDLYGLWVSSR